MLFITIIIAVIFLLAFLALVSVFFVDATDRLIPLIATGVLAVIGVVSLFFSTFVVVGATQVGVPVAFGHVSSPLDPGVHFVAPWVNVEEYPTRPLTVEDSVVARTKDAGRMSVTASVRWRVEKQDAKTLYFQSRTGDLDAISNTIVLPNMRQAIGQVYSITGNLDAISDRERVAEDIRKQLNKQLVPYGILIDAVQMRSVEPDPTTSQTISLFASQQQATRIAQEATKTAKIEAERRLIEAQGLKAASAAANGMTPSELQSICMQVWQQVISKGIDKGVSVYTNPCANSNGSLIVNTK